MHSFITQRWKKVEIRSSSFVDLDLDLVARRALEQANGALFLNRKLLVQLSTSRFRLQPKDQSVPCSSSSSSSSSSHPSSPSHKLLQPIRTGMSIRMVQRTNVIGSIPGMSNLLDTFASHDGKTLKLNFAEVSPNSIRLFFFLKII